MDPATKILLGFHPRTPNRVVRAEWNRRTRSVCKPCWELKYCPYGPLVEQFPLPPIARAEMVEHIKRLRRLLKEGVPDPERRKSIRQMVANFDPADHPVVPDRSNDDKACSVFFVNEPFTETREGRRIGRTIPRSVMLRVV